jgi:hypothetical protein
MASYDVASMLATSSNVFDYLIPHALSSVASHDVASNKICPALPPPKKGRTVPVTARADDFTPSPVGKA